MYKNTEDWPTETVFLNILFSLVAYITTWYLCGHKQIQQNFIDKGLFGKDVHKRGRPVIAESMGMLSGLVYLVAVFIFIPVPFMHWFVKGGLKAQDFPYDKLTQFLSCLLSLTCMLLLGFADDVLELRWRFKLLLPTVASIPILVVYYVTYGVTVVVVPMPLRPYFFGAYLIDLGLFYYLYMGMLAVFCTNAINILAGVNGVETGQTLVITLSLIVNDLLYVIPQLRTSGIVDKNSMTVNSMQTHLFSLIMLVPFLAVTLALHRRNRWPAQIFVGDCFCYFSGMLFAAVGILGQMSKTVLLFFMPQVFNFLYSLPQLMRLIPCPRHRMPLYDEKNDLLMPSLVDIKACRQATGLKLRLGWLIINIYYMLGLVQCYKLAEDEKAATDETQAVESKQAEGLRRKKQTSLVKDASSSDCQLKEPASYVAKNVTLAKATHVNNMTVLNLLLVKFGDLHELTLTRCVMAMQVLLSIAAFYIRYFLVGYFYP